MIEDPRRIWRDAEPFNPFRPLIELIEFVKDWLALACMVPIRPRVHDRLHRAAQAWSRGEKVLAYLHLAFGRLRQLQDPEDALFRQFAGGVCVKTGLSPRILQAAFEFDRKTEDRLEKYNPDERRVPPGNGRPSGEWTIGGAIAAAAGAVGALAADANSFFVDDLAPKALAGLADVAAEATAAGATAALSFGLFFIPSPGGSSVVDGAVPGEPNLLYHWDEQAGEVVFSWSIAGTAVPFNSARIGAGGLYYDASGRAIGRVVDGVLVMDGAAAAAARWTDDDEQSRAAAPAAAGAIANDNNEPKLCPAAGSDVGHGASADSMAYQSKVTGLEPGLAVWLNNVPFDGCRESDGVMLEAKGYGYDRFVDQNGQWQSWYVLSGGVAGLANQIASQSKAAAAAGRMVEWHVAEPRPAALIQEMAKNYSNIIVMWDPRYEQ